jgi:4-amino-4-deoxy-L-arabinose transferase-like glycosyltransferase
MKTVEERGARDLPTWLVWVIAIGFVLGGLGSFGILDNNEGLYAEIPREMLASHDWRQWVIPHLNGLPYMEKPPLLYWLTALSFAVFGESEWVARLVPASAALSCVAMLIGFGRYLGRPAAGKLAALMFITGVGVTAMSHVLMFDMLLTTLLTGALMFAYRYLVDNHLRHLRWSYALLALALLAKGLVALILFGLVVVTFDAIRSASVMRFVRSQGKWFEPGAIAVFVAIAAPWHIAASLTEPVFAWFYFINEHVLRFLGKREPHDYYSGGWWYYLPRMAIYLFPWSFIVPTLFMSKRDAATPKDLDLKRFLLLAWSMPLLFFSVSSAKANYYLVAVMPFAALHLALAIEDRGTMKPLTRVVPGLMIGVLAMVALVALNNRRGETAHSLTIMGLEQNSFALFFVGGIAVLALIAALVAWKRPHVSVLAYLLIPAWIAVGLSGVLEAMEPLASTRPLARVLQRDLAGRTIYLYRNFEEQSSLPFYLKHPIPVVDARSNDLYWGNRLRRNDLIISAEKFLADAKAGPVAIVVMRRQLTDFGKEGLTDHFPHQKIIGETTVFFN